jgi:hypothetical protein
VDPKENRPLVINAEEGVGKKTLLVKWMEYHRKVTKSKFDDLIIAHFATTGGNNANFYYAIYKILTKLRDKFDIEQKVELLEEKLRIYFDYWLGVCNDKLKYTTTHHHRTSSFPHFRRRQIVNDSMIILIFEGIDAFHDLDTGEESLVSFWLPK